MKRFLTPVVITSVLYGSSVFAVQSDDDFIEAEKIAKAGNYSEFSKVYGQLDHPLKPYVGKAFYSRHPHIKYQDEIESFLKVYDHTPIEWSVRTPWLKYLAKNGYKAEFVENYQSTSNAALTCQYLQFQLELGAPEKSILDQVDELWISGRSQPNECDRLFKKWQGADYLTDDKVWQRITLAAEGGTASLIPYLKTLLPKNEQYLGDLYATVRSDPSAAAGLYRYKNKNAKEAQIAHYGIKRLLWRDPDLAIRAWDKVQDMFTFSDEQVADMEYNLAYVLSVKRRSQAKFWLNKVDDERQDKKLRQWHLVNMLRESDFEGVVAFFRTKSNLTNGHKYWLAYSYNQLGNKEQAQQLWRELAQERDYYGFLAAGRLQQPVSLSAQKLVVAPEVKATVAQAPGYARAQALHRLERAREARREWHYLITTSTDEEMLAAGELAHESGWHDSAIITMAKLKAWDYVDIRFPKAYESLFERYSKRNRVDIDWSIAIARRESSFAADARSRADARGLMQLLPSTAKYINRGTVSNKRLYDPATNIKLGTKYLAYLEDKTSGNQVLATASYNAGYHRVIKWVPDEAVPAELWIEFIPYKETRDYVKNVYAYRQVYLTKRGEDKNVLNEILAMNIGG